MSRSWFLAGLLSCGGVLGCEVYDSPPRVSIVGLVDEVLTDATQPLDIAFSEPVLPASVRAKIVLFETDTEGNLFDEDENPETNLEIFFEHPADPTLTSKGTSELLSENQLLRITPIVPFRVGPKLALLIEPGLEDEDGMKTEVRIRIPFAYAFKCSENLGTEIFQTGAYFFLLSVEKPIGTQIQLFGDLRLDATNGHFVGMFANADRRTDQSCPTPCESSEVCRLLPTPSCVPPSERAGTVDEYSDYTPNIAAPTGYTLAVRGCVQDQPGGFAGIMTGPANIVVQQPAVTVSALAMTGAFELDGDGTPRGTGGVTAEDVMLGTVSSGPAEGTFTGRLIPPGKVPAGIPSPNEEIW